MLQCVEKNDEWIVLGDFALGEGYAATLEQVTEPGQRCDGGLARRLGRDDRRPSGIEAIEDATKHRFALRRCGDHILQ
jgi:hypothetical protein